MVGLADNTSDIKEVGRAARRFVDDRRNDERYAAERTATAANMADIGRQQETANLDQEYDLYKRNLSRGIQAFAMDPRNYQEAVDVVNQYYDRDARVTHHVDPNNPNADPTFDIEVTDPKTGEKRVRTGMTKKDLGQMFMMSQNPSEWYNAKVERERATKIAQAEQEHDLDKIDRKGAWDTLIARIKSAGDSIEGTGGLKYLKEMRLQANTSWGTLGDDGLFAFEGEYDDDYAAMNAALGSVFAQYGGDDLRGNTTEAHNRALRMIKQQQEVYEKDLRANHPDLDDEEINAKVRDLVYDYTQNISDMYRTRGEPATNREEQVKDRWADIEKAMRDANISDEAIAEAKKKYGVDEGKGEGGGPGGGEPEAETVKAGLQESQKQQEERKQQQEKARAEGEAKTTEMVEQDMAGEEPGLKEPAPEDPGEKLESAAQKGDVGLVEDVKPVSYGSTSTRSKRGAEGRAAGDKTLSKDIETARGHAKGYKDASGKEVYYETAKLKSLREKAAQRVMSAYEGGGSITSRKILEAALASGELTPEVTKQVKVALGTT